MAQYCKKCGTLLELEDYYTDYRDDETIIVTEHYWCPTCNYGPGAVTTRLATYTLKREAWEHETDEN